MTTPEENPPDKAAQPATKPTLLGRIRNAVTDWWGPSDASFKEKTSNELAEIRTDLAVSRNLMAADRTLMAWIRTALSMNSFGFTIYKLLETYEASGASLPQGQTPRNIGLFLTGLGILGMVMGVVEYWQTLKELQHMRALRHARPAFVMGILMAVMGVFLFFAIFTKLF